MASEKRLIDANKIPYHRSGFPKGDGVDSGLDWAFRVDIDNVPPVDAVEVAHGRCEYCKDGKSFIGARMLLGNDGKWHDINNCPNCGAKMDGDGNG